MSVPCAIALHLCLLAYREGVSRLGRDLMSDYALLVALRLLRHAAVHPPDVRSLRSRRRNHSAPEREAVEAFLGAPLVGGSPHAELVLADDVLDSATVGADAELAAFFRGLLGPGAPSEPPSTLDRVRSVIADSLLHGAPSLPEVARSLAVSTRTLQRRLAAEQASFSDVLDDVRRERAARYLREPTLSIAEVAYLLGYTEHASFYRAFRRWYDQTPAEFRASVA
ncbi:MAG: helix-turn-helix transcriptional regulator [Myxococcota bacterium]